MIAININHQPVTSSLQRKQSGQPVSTGLVHMAFGEPVTTSLVIAQKFGKRHDTVLRSIRNLSCPKQFRLRNFAESSYSNEQGRIQPCYQMTRDGFAILAMGFTGKSAAEWKIRFLDAFNALEKEVYRLHAYPCHR